MYNVIFLLFLNGIRVEKDLIPGNDGILIIDSFVASADQRRLSWPQSTLDKRFKNAIKTLKALLSDIPLFAKSRMGKSET